MIPQIDEQQIAMIALAMHPPRKPDRFADMRRARRAAGMGAIGMHDRLASGKRMEARKIGSGGKVKRGVGGRFLIGVDPD
jgi:hypothetical protein